MAKWVSKLKWVNKEPVVAWEVVVYRDDTLEKEVCRTVHLDEEKAVGYMAYYRGQCGYYPVCIMSNADGDTKKMMLGLEKA